MPLEAPGKLHRGEPDAHNWGTADATQNCPPTTVCYCFLSLPHGLRKIGSAPVKQSRTARSMRGLLRRST
jgi:hypothetical protein